ncbi:hypothetical protein PENTCL1PPCAC_8168, partial [Pristionchus entomophagus]
VSYHSVAQFAYYEKYWTHVLRNPACAANSVGVVGATFGKSFIAIHRYSVMRALDLAEKNWSRSVIVGLLLIQFALPLALSTPCWLASYDYRNGNSSDQIIGMSPVHKLVLKTITVSIYTIFIISNGIFTILTSRELAHLRKMLNANDGTGLAQRNMFIIVIACSVSHLLKAFQQVMIAVATHANRDDLYVMIMNWVRKLTRNQSTDC